VPFYLRDAAASLDKECILVLVLISSPHTPFIVLRTASSHLSLYHSPLSTLFILFVPAHISLPFYPFVIVLFPAPRL
jgi:hypothetical protein